MEASTRVVGLPTGLARTEEAEFARERGSVKEPSSSVPTEERLGFQRVDIVEMREPTRGIPFNEVPSEHLDL